MKTTHFQFLSLAICLGSPLALSAPEPLSWESCVREAAGHNPAVAAAAEGVKSAEAQLKASYGNFFPQVSASASALHNSSSNSASSITGVPGTAPGVTIGSNGSSNNQYTFGVTATQQLFSGFKDRSHVHQNRAGVEAAQAGLDLAKAQLSATLKNAFAELLYAESLMDVSTRIAQRSRQNLRLVKLRFEGGRENKGSYLLSQAELAQAEAQIAHARRDGRVAQRQLAQAMGRPAGAAGAPDDSITVVGKLETATPGDPPDFRELALRTPSHRQAVAQSASARASSDIVRAQFYPELDLIGAYTRQGTNNFPNNTRWYAGLSLSIPIFNGGQHFFGLESAQASERQAELSQANIDATLLPQLEQAFANFQDAVTQRDVAEKYLEAASARATIARGKYSAGLMTFEDWDIIENDLINRETNALQARKSAVVAEAAWEQAQGRGAIP